MMSFGKFALCFGVTLCLFQFAVGRYNLDMFLVENIKFDLNRNCANMERDFEREFANARHKITQEYMKLNEKAKEEAKECIKGAQLEAEVNLDDKSQDLLTCVKEVQETLETDLKPDAKLFEVFSFRNLFRNQLRNCRNVARLNVKTIRNTFSNAGKKCLQ